LESRDISLVGLADWSDRRHADDASFVPQVAKAWRRRSVNDLSLTMLLMFATGVALWLVTGS
jgi:hypothetical protein